MQKYSILFFLIGSLTMATIVTIQGESLKTKDTPLGVLNLEFAFNSSHTQYVLAAWHPKIKDNIEVAKKNTWLDFIFLFFYSIFLFLACKAISRSFGGLFGRAGKFIAKGAILAGLLDIIENIGMLLTLSGKGSDTIALCTTICSVIKWALALLAVLYVITAGVALLRSRLTR